MNLWSSTTGRTYSDLTGHFIVPSSQGNKYIFILYDHDSNTIHAEPMRDQHAATILTAYKKLYDLLFLCCKCPQLHILDNECSNALKDYINDEGTDYQLIPPGMHRHNTTE